MPGRLEVKNRKEQEQVKVPVDFIFSPCSNFFLSMSNFNELLLCLFYFILFYLHTGTGTASGSGSGSTGGIPKDWRVPQSKSRYGSTSTNGNTSASGSNGVGGAGVGMKGPRPRTMETMSLIERMPLSEEGYLQLTKD